MKKVKKKVIIFIVIVLLVICLIPLKIDALNDGGTVIYRAILYTIIDWDQLSEYNEKGEEIRYNEKGEEITPKKGIEVILFPKNLSYDI